MAKRFCFPKMEEFQQKYFKSLSQDPYLAEKTWPTINMWLSGQCLVDYSLVPFYAVDDFEQYLSKTGGSTWITAKMQTDQNYHKILNALNVIKTPELPPEENKV
jgi:hypothetical protein